MKENIKLPFGKLVAFISVSLIASILSVSLAFIIQVTIDSTGQQNKEQFIKIIYLAIIFIVLYALFYYLRSYCMQSLINTTVSNLRKNLFTKITSQAYVDYRQASVADYLSVLTNDIHTYQEGALKSKLLIIQNSFSLIAAIIALFLSNSKIMLLVIVSSLIIYFIPTFIRKKINCAQKEVTQEISSLTNYCESYLKGFYVVYTYGKQGYVQDSFQMKNNKHHKARLYLERLISESETISATLLVVMELMILFVSGNFVFNGIITVGAMVAIMQLTGAFVQPLMIVMQNIPRLSSGKALEERFATILNKQAVPLKKDIAEKIPFNNTITLSGINFEYTEGNPVLENINLSFEKGKKYAVIGGSGSGKTTLINLVNGLYYHYIGNVIIDNQIVDKSYSTKYMNLFATVSQNVFLFNTTIADNITLSNSFNERLFYKVCKISGIDKIVKEMKEGYNSKIIDNGVSLSGGQRQRIALARALYHEKPVLILDEGTSAIDKTSTYEIEKSLLKMKDLLLITITHDVGSPLLTDYDEIIFMDNGTVLSHGNYDELIKSKEQFKEFVKGDAK